MEQAMHAAGHTKLDTTLVYELIDRDEQEQGIRGFQERILGVPQRVGAIRKWWALENSNL